MEGFMEGDLVWFDPGVGYLIPGEVLEYSRPAQVVTVQAVISGQPQSFTLTNLTSVKKRQDLGQNGIEDMVNIVDLNETSLLWNLKIRYEKEFIYTYTGSILVAVNPYKMFDIYGLEMVKKYEGQILGTLPPHLFAIGSSAYSKMSKDNECQVVVISGESGAGKTESTKLIMQYLAAVNKSPSNLITEQILEASPLLESFGNAKTVRNNNSSRFGKYLEIHFKDGVITGAKTTDYLLEKSRIVTQASDERNYHVFYELLVGLSETEKEKYGLQSADKYFYLNQGGSYLIEAKDDSEDFRSLLSAMQVLGFTSEEQDTIFRILAAVLHIGNVYFHRKQMKHGQEGVEIGSDAEIRWASHLLQLSVEGILRALTTKTTDTTKDSVITPLNIDQALDAGDAVAKALYSTLFSWLVQRVNQIVYKEKKQTSIAILDIFGFENFRENSFEQLCINYANETFQMFFNKHVFKLEQQEYAKEKIEWQAISYPDNQPVINLISKKPVGIFPLLDDESNFPKATDVSFLEKCHYNHALSELYSRPRMSSMEFGVQHYAGQVWYSVDGFLDKNRDTFRTDVMNLLISSKISMIASMFLDLRKTKEAAKTINKSNGRFVTMKPRTPTVAARFHDSLHSLLETMIKCNPWFVRCIKPNNEKAAMKLDMPTVLEQLRYTGMLETIKIRKLGFPIRMKFSQFVDRYRCLVPGRIPKGAPAREICRVILNRVPNWHEQYQLGTTKVFLREALEQKLEKERVDTLKGSVVLIQRHVRRYLARKKYQALKIAAVRIQTSFRGYRCRRQYQKVRRGVIRAQANWRMLRQKREYDKIKAILERKKEADRLAMERAKERAAREEKERASRAVAGVNHLEIPAELAFIFSKLDEWHCTHSDRNVIKAVGQIPQLAMPQLQLPRDIDQYAFTKFTNIYFKAHIWGMKREPIKTSFLAKTKDGDYQDSLAIFKLILRFMNDNNLSGKKERVLADYVVQKGLVNESMRDEILCQLCNQTWKNENEANNERGWLLMSNCLSCFPPSKTLYKYLLKYVSDHAYDGYKCHCQQKLLQSQDVEPQNARTYPPTLLEWKANTRKANMALEAKFADGGIAYGPVESWTVGEDFASSLLKARGIDEGFGWSVELLDDGDVYDLNGNDYVLDLISEIEIPPAFPVCKSYFMVSPDRQKSEVVQRKPAWANSPHNPEKINTFEIDIQEAPPAPVRHHPTKTRHLVSNGVVRSEHVERARQELEKQARKHERHFHLDRRQENVEPKIVRQRSEEQYRKAVYQQRDLQSEHDSFDSSVQHQQRVSRKDKLALLDKAHQVEQEPPVQVVAGRGSGSRETRENTQSQLERIEVMDTSHSRSLSLEQLKEDRGEGTTDGGKGTDFSKTSILNEIYYSSRKEEEIKSASHVMRQEIKASLSPQDLGLSKTSKLNQRYEKQVETEDPREGFSKTSKLNQRYEQREPEDPRDGLSKTSKLNQRYEQREPEDPRDGLSKTSKLNQRYEQKEPDDPREVLSKTSKLNQRYEQRDLEGPRDGLSKTSKLNQRYEVQAEVEERRDAPLKSRNLNQSYDKQTTVEETREILSKTSKLNQRYEKQGETEDSREGLSKTSKLNARYDNQVDPLSETSKLNKRYLQTKMGTGRGSLERPRAPPPPPPEPRESTPPPSSSNEPWVGQLGLASSALNDRYFSQLDLTRSQPPREGSEISSRKLGPDSKRSSSLHDISLLNGQGRKSNSSSYPPSGVLSGRERASSPQPSSNGGVDFPELDFTQMSTRDSDQEGDHDTSPYSRTTESTRYVKYNSKKPQPSQYSHSTKAHIGRTKEAEYSGVRSSALSDTSEAPSLASHVRNVHVPSHASDLDQYLDELFNPVLDGNLDEMSDARSLAASIKGRTSTLRNYSGKPNTETSDHILTGRPIEDISEEILDDDLAGLTNPYIVAKALKGGGDRKAPSSSISQASDDVDEYLDDLFRPVLNSECEDLTDATAVALSLKGGGQTGGGVETQVKNIHCI